MSGAPESTKVSLLRVLREEPGIGPEAIGRRLSLRLNRPVSHHDVVKLLWSLQKDGAIRLKYTHRDGRSRSGQITRIEVIR